MHTKDYAIAKRYVLSEILGRGSFAEVWAAYDQLEKKEVAIKICKAALIAEDEKEREKAIRRFCDEIALMKRAKSTYVVEILDYGKEREEISPYTWYYYIVMERMYSTLAEYLQKRRESGKGGLNIEEFFRYAGHCLAGLSDLHKKGIIHRDIKPSNFLFSRNNILNIGDLGIARLSERTRNTQTMFGTVGYAAAELFIHKEKATIQSDLFSLGISFYEMLTARHPCSDKGPFYLSRETIRRLVTADFYPLRELRPDLPERLVEIIESMTSLNPNVRPSVADDIAKEFDIIRHSLSQDHLKEGMEHLSQKNYEKALESFHKAGRMYPDNPESYNHIGLICYSQGKYDLAIEEFSQLLHIVEDKVAYNNRGLCHYSMQNYDEAIVDFSRAIQIDPKFAEAYNNRGLAYHKKKEYYRAIQNFNRSIGLRKNDANAYNNRGVTYNEQGAYDKAILDFSRAIKIKPDDHESYFNRGLANFRQGNYKMAIADFSKAMDYDPNDLQSYCQRGITYKRLQEYDKALEDFKKALLLKPTSENIKKNIDYCQDKVKKSRKNKQGVKTDSQKNQG